MNNLLGKTLEDLSLIIKNFSLPQYVAKQLMQWIYKKRVFNFEKMTNISSDTRKLLSQHFKIEINAPVQVTNSIDGTKKYLFSSESNKFFESVYIPDNDRYTLCVSTQAGCRMNCYFCLTGKQGYNGQLDAGDILNQILNIAESKMITNVVYMGMGEPLDNLTEVLRSINILTDIYGLGWSPKRITVSTVGIIPSIEKFLTQTRCHLAISLHTPFHEERKKLMPIENKYPIKEVIQVLRKYNFTSHRRISFEYILFKGINDTYHHVKETCKLLNGLNCRINLIRFHSIPGVELTSSEDATIFWFQEQLKLKGFTTTIRASRGQDIWAACGMLATDAVIKKS